MIDKKAKKLSRRKFMQLTASMVGGATLTGTGLILFKSHRDKFQTLEAVWYLNPAFRIKELSRNNLELFTHLSDGRELKHGFEGLEADLLRLIAEEILIDTQIEILARRHGLTFESCRKQAAKSIQEFNEARLIYTGEKMLVKVVGA
ncbi:MAG: hypothetical protein ACE5HS_20790 [bacterium]